MAKRQRIDSVTGKVAVMQSASRQIIPPEHVPLTKADFPFWDSIIAERPKADWTDSDRAIAAEMAKDMRRLRDDGAKLDSEGSVLASVGGSPMQNPRCRVVADLRASVLKYRQSLGIHDRGKNGEKRDVDKRRKQAFDVEAANPLDDDLLAKPLLN